MSEQSTETTYRAGFVAVMGRPNVGKSSLVNAMLEQPVAAVSPRPQTTRKRQMGILSLPDAQIIFEDTPGVHIPQHLLGRCMNDEALQALEQADLVLFVAELNTPPNDEDRLLASELAAIRRLPGVLLVLNKSDLVKPNERESNNQAYQALLPQAAATYEVSSTTRDGLDELVNAIAGHLPERPPFFPEEQVTDLTEREIAADLIRAAALLHLRDEVPHGIAVRIEEFLERDEGGAYISATLLAERENHKGIIIGQNGQMLKQIGMTARQEIEAMSGRRVYLQLLVKVRKNWRSNPAVLRSFGYKLPKDVQG